MPDDPMQVLIVPVPDGPEKAEVLRLFRLTTPASVHVKGVFYVQNLALWRVLICAQEADDVDR